MPLHRPAPHHAHWPPGQPRRLTLPETSLFYNLEVSATRYPDKPCIRYYGSVLTYRQVLEGAERVAGYLQRRCGVSRGDRVLLYMQNSPQWVIAFYGILRANAVVVPVNPMNKTQELRHYVADTDASVVIVPQDLYPQVRPLVGGQGLRHAIVACYADALQAPPDMPVPALVQASRETIEEPGVASWSSVMDLALVPGPLEVGPDDPCAMPYTSGTTGAPKGCIHTHRSVMCTSVGGIRWFGRSQDDVYLSALPFFHVTGLTGSLHGPIYAGATMVILTRWDRDAALQAIERHGVTAWQSISTMMIDFLAQPGLEQRDLSSLLVVRGGGAAMPEAVAQELLRRTGLRYVEGYGMSETMAATHINPPHRPKPQCLGIPVFDVDARLVDPDTLQEVPPGEVGEIVVHAPQVMQGYWRQPEATAQAFVQIDGKRFLRTGDLARVDDEGYFFMADRLKRMINASGYKVWPAEVEALLYRHPAIQEACVIGSPDAHRGETVKALVVLKPEYRGTLPPQSLIDWAHEHMAAYKAPRLVEFVDDLPKSGSGKVQWRELQELERQRASGPTAKEQAKG
ncbi:MAG TPA: long-chain fatty acid--CoA ligase [Burkholderiaceae bacterium]|nr:long-chain fatty acid--CoA ligase [Burkholderiaceae bacterium]